MQSRRGIEKTLASRMPRSHAAYIRAKKVIPGGVLSRARLFSPFPLYVHEGRGSKVVDLDGNEIIDCAMGYGALILGHAHPVIVQAIQEAANRGSQFGIPHESEFRLAHLMRETIPSLEKVTFCNSGSEAIHQAIRILRAITGKTKIAKFEGGYHGGTDEVLASFRYNKERGGPINRPRTVPDSVGIPPEAHANTMVLPYNSRAAFQIIEENSSNLAAVLVEVIQGSAGDIIGRRAFIQSLRRITRELAVPLLVDEIITGYRLGLGGGQDYYEIQADVATYGKIIGGGLPCGAIAGRNWIMDAIAYTGDSATDAESKPFYGGTFNGNLLTMCAGTAALQYLVDHPEIYAELDRLGNQLRDRVNKFCTDQELPVQMIGAGSMFCTHFTNENIKSVRDLGEANTEAARAFYPRLLEEGVFIPSIHMGFISAAHTEEDIGRVILAHCNALKAVREIGLI